MPLHLWDLKLFALRSVALDGVVRSDGTTWHGMASSATRNGKPFVTLRAPDPDTSPLRASLRSLGLTIRIRIRGHSCSAYAVRRLSPRLAECYLGTVESLPVLSSDALHNKLLSTVPASLLVQTGDRGLPLRC